MKLLLVEDNDHLAEDLNNFFKESGFIVESAAMLQEAREKINIYEYDLAIIDLGLPDGSGLNLVKEIKQLKAGTGILILTAKDSLEDKVDGLDLGADDYLTKPFHKAELNARIRSILRRNKFRGKNILEIKEIKVDFTRSEVYVNGKALKLTKKEYDLLIYFMQNPERLLTKEDIAEHLWGDHIDQADSFDFVYNHIKNLRKKIIDAGGNNYIKASYGMGYKFSTD
jgi:DNA-binding response OmpR family regulator